MALRICINYSLTFLALWAGLSTWLLIDQGWGVSGLGTVGALGLGYMFGGLIVAAIFAGQMIWEASKPRRPARRIVPLGPSRLAPALAARRIGLRRRLL